MKRSIVVAKRNVKETLRDPLSLIFCLGFPLVMLALMELIFAGIDEAGAEMFKIENFAAGIAVFGYTFIALFVSLSVSGDRESAFMTRILVSPLKPFEYFAGYVMSALLLSLCQTVIFYFVSLVFKLKITVGFLVSIIYLFPSALFYISVGLLIGALVKTEKQAGPINSIIISGAGILGGLWMPLDSIGGVFYKVCEVLPFLNSVNPAKFALNGRFDGVGVYFLITVAYTTLNFILGFLVFRKKLK